MLKNKYVKFILIGAIVLVLAIISVLVLLKVNTRDKNNITISEEVLPIEDTEPKDEIDPIHDSNAILEITDVEDVERSEDIEEVYGFTPLTCEELIESDEYKYHLGDTPLEPYAISRSIADDGYIQYIVGFKNTDAEEHIYISNSEESDYMYNGIANKYGSDYSVVYFNNGVPSNSEDIYDKLYEEGISSELFTSDYTTGDTVNLISKNGEEVTIILN